MVETCRPDKYTIVYIINVVLMTDVLYLYVVTLREGNPQIKQNLNNSFGM